MTNARSPFRLPLCLIALLVVCLMPHARPLALAEDGAHGGDTNTSPQGQAPKPGEAVKAPRTTQTYTEKGMAPNPIAIDFDPQGNLYVVDAGRAGISVIDNRNAGLRRSNGVINDLRKTSVEDRLKQIEMLEEEGYYPKGVFNKADDKIHFVQDTDGDGVADKSTVFAEHFNDKLDGIAAGVLWHEGKVYLTNIPHLWLLEDKDGDGDADKQTEGERTSLSYGYGIRWAFYGHDMHGLIKGPDGRIYFSIGDRGYNVTTQEGKHLYGPDQGAVFRMWPDGSGLEVFHEGLRNPQELAFDNYGNLFTGDNNSDSGDQARFVFVTEGGHSGWNQDVQSLRDRGPWNREHMWKPRFAKDDPSQPAWITPPLANVGRGPSGLAHYPGTGDVFPANGSFLLCDYPAGVRHVYVEPQGAGFKVVEDSSLPVVGSTITDIAWGYDGRLYLADWGGGWKPNPNGHLKTMVNEAAHQQQAAVIAEVEKLFAEGFDTLSDEKLIELLGHRDQRVRLEAQWELGQRPVGKILIEAMSDNRNSELQRLHAVWAMGMACRSDIHNAHYLDPILNAPSAVVRAQAASVLGDLFSRELDVSQQVLAMYEELKRSVAAEFFFMLQDDDPVVQYHAAIALGKVGTATHIGPLLDLLDRNDNNDAYLRHAASYGLSLIGDAEAIHTQAQGRGPAARLGAVLALRQLKSPLLAEYLDDDDLLVAAEAARAVYDMRVEQAMPALAAMADRLTQPQMIEPILRRVIEANVRLADADSAARLARLAANPDLPEMWQSLALQELGQWSAQRNREGVWGHWWPRPEQTMDHAVAALQAHLPAIKRHAAGDVLIRARLLELEHIRQAEADQLAAIAGDADEADDLRLAAVDLLASKDRGRAVQVTEQVLASLQSQVALRRSLRSMLLELDKDAATAAYLRALETGEFIERQDAIGVLARDRKSERAKQALTGLARQLADGSLAPELRLDVYQAVSGARHLPEQARYAATQYAKKNTLPGEAPFIRDAILAGGSIQQGRDLFLYHADAQCMRCHGDPQQPDASAIGPWLGTTGAQHDPAYLYYAMVKPSRDIADGYASSTVTLKDGQIKTGRILKAKSDAQTLVLVNSDGEEQPIPRDQIQGTAVTSDQSQMPAMTDKLRPQELRDVLAYLASLTEPPAGASLAPGLAATTGPSMARPAASIVHAVWLPAILLAIAAGLGLILGGTVLGGADRG